MWPRPRDFLFLILTCTCYSQPFRREIATIPVRIGADSLSQPFAGGINTPNHQFVDIDGDGDLDLFIFDDDLLVDFYRNEGTPASPKFVLRPHDVPLPPFNVWFVFADLNGDGLPDLATDDSTSQSVRLYWNRGTRQNPDFVPDAPQLLDSAGNPMLGAPVGVPVFADLTGDGLPEYLSSNLLNGSLNYYLNIGTASSPRFKFVTDRLDNIIVIGDTCTSGALAKKSAHGGAALRFADLHHSGTKDLYYGDLFSHGLFLMTNAGTPLQPDLRCATSRYPDTSLVTYGFNQSSFVDLDGDGDLDLAIGILNNMYRHGFWYYENTGDSLNPAFTLRTKDFLSILDAGGNASPAVADLNGDGLPDLVIGADQPSGGVLWLLENTGSRTHPSFALADTLFSPVSGNTLAPAFADLNGDGLPDMAVGEFSGVVKIFLNIGTRNSPRFDTASAHVTTFTTGPYNASPAFADIDRDGDQDLFVGKSNGQILYYRNDGDASSPNFVLATSNFSGISVGENAKPAFADIDRDGDSDLFVGNFQGRIFFYENTGNPDQLIYRQDDFGSTDPVRDSAPALYDIDGDGDIDLFVGTSKGGIHFYRNALITGVSAPAGLPQDFRLLQNYPNPFNSGTRIAFEIHSFEKISVQVLDLFGREMSTLATGRKAPGSYQVEWNAVDFPSGVYYYRLATEKSALVRSMLLIR